jgi:hypothetical protein
MEIHQGLGVRASHEKDRRDFVAVRELEIREGAVVENMRRCQFR